MSTTTTAAEQRELHELYLQSAPDLDQSIKLVLQAVCAKSQPALLNLATEATKDLVTIYDHLPAGEREQIEQHRAALLAREQEQTAAAAGQNSPADNQDGVQPPMPDGVEIDTLVGVQDLLSSEDFKPELAKYIHWLAAARLLREGALSADRTARLEKLEDSLSVNSWEEWPALRIVQGRTMVLVKQMLKGGGGKTGEGDVGEAPARRSFKRDRGLARLPKTQRGESRETRRYTLWQTIEQWKCQVNDERNIQNVSDAFRDDRQLASCWSTWLSQRKKKEDYDKKLDRGEHLVVDEFLVYLIQERANPSDFVREMIVSITRATQLTKKLPLEDFLEWIAMEMTTIESIADQTTYKVTAWQTDNEVSKTEFIKNRLCDKLKIRLCQERRKCTRSAGEIESEEYDSVEELLRWALGEASSNRSAFDPFEKSEVEDTVGKGATRRFGTTINAFGEEEDSEALLEEAEPQGGGAPAQSAGSDKLEKLTAVIAALNASIKGEKPPAKPSARRGARRTAQINTATVPQREFRRGGGWTFDAKAAAHNFLPKFFGFGEGLLPPDRHCIGGTNVCARWYNRHDARCPGCTGQGCRYDHSLTAEEEEYREKQLADQLAGKVPSHTMPGRERQMKTPSINRMRQPAINTATTGRVPSSTDERLNGLTGLVTQLTSTMCDIKAEMQKSGGAKPPAAATINRAAVQAQRQAQINTLRAAIAANQEEDADCCDGFFPLTVGESCEIDAFEGEGAIRKVVRRGCEIGKAVFDGGSAILSGKSEWWDNDYGKDSWAGEGDGVKHADATTRVHADQYELGLLASGAPDSNPHIELNCGGILLSGMIDSGAHITGAISRRLANWLRSNHPELVGECVKYDDPVPVNGIDKKGPGKGAKITGEMTITLGIGGCDFQFQKLAVLEEARFGRSDLIIGNIFMYQYGIVINYDDLSLVLRRPPKSVGHKIVSPLMVFEGKSRELTRLKSGDYEPRIFAPGPRRVVKFDSASTDTLSGGNTADAWLKAPSGSPSHVTPTPSRQSLGKGEAAEFKYAWAPKVMRVVMPLMLCLAVASTLIAPGETKTLECVARVGRHAVPSFDFLPDGSRHTFDNLSVGEGALYRTRLDGTISLPITNNNKSGYCLESGDELGYIYRPTEVRRLEPVDATRTSTREAIDSLPPLDKADREKAEELIMSFEAHKEQKEEAAARRCEINSLWAAATDTVVRDTVADTVADMYRFAYDPVKYGSEACHGSTGLKNLLHPPVNWTRSEIEAGKCFDMPLCERIAELAGEGREYDEVLGSHWCSRASWPGERLRSCYYYTEGNSTTTSTNTKEAVRSGTGATPLSGGGEAAAASRSTATAEKFTANGKQEVHNLDVQADGTEWATGSFTDRATRLRRENGAVPEEGGPASAAHHAGEERGVAAEARSADPHEPGVNVCNMFATLRVVRGETAVYDTVLPVVSKASAKEVIEAKLQGDRYITSVDPNIFDDPNNIPVIVLYSGMGGLTTGVVPEAPDGYNYIVVLAVDESQDAVEAHRLNNPAVPVMRYRIEGRRQLRELVRDFLPEKYWSKMWVHASNSCKTACTANRRRNIELAHEQTLAAVQQMMQFNPATWTLENSPALYQYFRGQYPTAMLVQMRRHAMLPSERTRLIVSNQQLQFSDNEQPPPTPHDVLGEELGWGEEQRWSRQSYGSVRSTREPGFTVTSGMHHVGAKTLGDFNTKNTPTATQRAKLIGFELNKLPVFPQGMSQGKRISLVGEVIPPLFAKALQRSMHHGHVNTMKETELRKRLDAVSKMGEAEAVNMLSLLKEDPREVAISRLVPQTASKATAPPLPTEPQATSDNWNYWGDEYGWARVGENVDQVVRRLQLRPWSRIDHPPPPKASAVEVREWWGEHRCRAEAARLRGEETYSMGEEDHDAETRRTVRNASTPTSAPFGQFTNVHPDPLAVAHWDSNKALQASDPENYGPYLEEGEKYNIPRTNDNFQKACTSLGLNALPKDCEAVKGELQKIIYDRWILFDGKLREIKGVKVDMDMGDTKPIRVHPYRWSPAKTAIARQLINDFVKQGILSPVNSPWGFGGVVVPKPHSTPENPEHRMCIDLRPLNEKLPRDNFEPPSCDLCLEWLAGKRYRTTLDCRWGFYQVGLTDRAKAVLTLNTSIGTYCFERLVMGHLNATAEFQRHINYTLGDSLWNEALAMVDDVIVGNGVLTEHVTSLRRVLDKLAKRHHSIKPEKMHILCELLEYLGHISTPSGTLISDKHKLAITEMPYPVDASGTVNRTSVRSFIGMIKYCRRYIEKCAKVCGPLNNLTSETVPAVWSNLHSLTWDLLKYQVAHNKGVWHIDYTQPIYVSTDGSKGGIGGYIWQRIDGEERVVSYYSRKTTADERKWDTRELEVLALICTLEHFHVLIDGHLFTAYTDHRNTEWLLKQKNLSGRLGRWVLRLSEYRFILEYREGKKMEVADCMSRNSKGSVSDPTSVIELGLMEMGEGMYELTMPHGHDLGDMGIAVIKPPIAEDSPSTGFDRGQGDSLAAAPLVNYSRSLETHKLTVDDFRTAQHGDPYACEKVKAVKAGEPAADRNFIVLDGVLHHVDGGAEGDTGRLEAGRIYVPPSLRDKVFHNFHNSIYGCHRNAHATLYDMSTRFWWSTMREDVREEVRRCRECQLAKGYDPKRQGLLHGTRHDKVFEQLNLDLIGPIVAGRATHVVDDDPSYIMTATDPFSHMVWFEIIDHKTAEKVYQRFADRILLEEGTPRVVLTDNGGEFDNELLRGLMAYMKTRHRLTPFYMPRGNYAERVNRFVGEILRTIMASGDLRKSDWPGLIKYIEFAYRRMPIPGTDFTPFMVARGRQPRLPSDQDLQLEGAAHSPIAPPLPLHKHVAELDRRLELARLLVLQAREQAMEANKQRFDASHVEESFNVGELVRFWRRIPAVRDSVTGLLNSSKLQLRNSVWRIANRRGHTYDLTHDVTNKTATAHVSQLARFWQPTSHASRPELPAAADNGNSSGNSSGDPIASAQNKTSAAISQEDMRKELKIGSYVCFHDTMTPTRYTVHVAEVLNIDQDNGILTIWYLWDASQGDALAKGGKYRENIPMLDWRSQPEWFDPVTNVAVASPTDEKKKTLKRRTAELAYDELIIIVPSFTDWRKVGGGFLPALTKRVDHWLRSLRLTPKQLLKVLSAPTADELTGNGRTTRTPISKI